MLTHRTIRQGSIGEVLGSSPLADTFRGHRLRRIQPALQSNDNFVDAPEHSHMQPLLDSLLSAVRAGRPVAYTALVETRGCTPQKAGATMLVFPDGSQAGTLGGGCVEAEVKRRALALLPEGQPQLLAFSSTTTTAGTTA